MFSVRLDCFHFVTDKIVDRIKEAGFRIISRKDVGLTKELASQFYQEHEGKDFFNGLTDYMSRYLSTRKVKSLCLSYYEELKVEALKC